MPHTVRTLLDTLQGAGYEAFIVGGCVRDSLLMKCPSDWDIATSAHPAEVKRLFRRTVDTGIKHGTVTVLSGNKSFEVTTYRSDGDYTDHRHPETVRFTGKLEDDLKRRDFTVNAMAYSDSAGLIDLYGGEEDLKQGIIRAVGDPYERFDEDALRMLRAVRFSGELGFSIAEETREAIRSRADLLRFISRERILSEITRLICSSHIEKLSDVFNLGLAPYIAEGFDKIDTAKLFELKFGEKYGYKSGINDFTEGFNTYYNVNADDIDDNEDGRSSRIYDLDTDVGRGYRYIRFVYVCLGLEGAEVSRMLRSLKADNDTIRRSAVLADLIFKTFPLARYELKKMMSGLDEGIFEDALNMKEHCRHMRIYQTLCEGEDLDRVFATFTDIKKAREAVYLKDLALSGDDLKAAGFPEGPYLGNILRYLLDLVHRDPCLNVRQELLVRACEIGGGIGDVIKLNKLPPCACTIRTDGTFSG